MGVSHYTEVPLSEHFSVSVGSAVYASSNNPVTSDQRDKNQTGDVTQQSNQGYGFYLRPTLKAELNPLEGLKLRSQLILRATGYFNNNSRTTKTYTNGSVTSESSNPMISTFLGDGNGSLVSDITYTRGNRSRTMLQWDISGQVSNIAAASGFELYLRRVGISHDENFDLGYGRIRTNTSFNLVPLNNGVNPIIASGGVSFLPDGGRQLYTLGFTGSLNPESTPAFIPGASARRLPSLRNTKVVYLFH